MQNNFLIKMICLFLSANMAFGDIISLHKKCIVQPQVSNFLAPHNQTSESLDALTLSDEHLRILSRFAKVLETMEPAEQQKVLGSVAWEIIQNFDKVPIIRDIVGSEELRNYKLNQYIVANRIVDFTPKNEMLKLSKVSDEPLAKESPIDDEDLQNSREKIQHVYTHLREMAQGNFPSDVIEKYFEKIVQTNELSVEEVQRLLNTIAESRIRMIRGENTYFVDMDVAYDGSPFRIIAHSGRGVHLGGQEPGLVNNKLKYFQLNIF